MSGAETINEEIVELTLDDVKVVRQFSSYHETLNSLQKWCDNNYFPLIKRSTRPGNLSCGGEPGRIQLICTHGLKRQSKASNARPAQRVNFTGCPARVLINHQPSGIWKVTTAVNHHDGHIIAKDVYNSYQHVQKLSAEDEEYLKDLIKVRAAKFDSGPYRDILQPIQRNP